MLGMLGPIIAAATQIIPQIFQNKADQKKAEAAMQQFLVSADLQKLTLQMQPYIEQIKVNAIEAQSESLFKSGWRPFIGWTCGIAFAYQFLLQPFLFSLFSLFGIVLGVVQLDMAQLMTVLLGILGLGAYRSYDKQKENPISVPVQTVAAPQPGSTKSPRFGGSS